MEQQDSSTETVRIVKSPRQNLLLKLTLLKIHSTVF